MQLRQKSPLYFKSTSIFFYTTNSKVINDNDNAAHNIVKRQKEQPR